MILPSGWQHPDGYPCGASPSTGFEVLTHCQIALKAARPDLDPAGPLFCWATGDCRAREITERGLHAKDALHVACAMAADSDFFLTTEDVVVTRMRGFSRIAVMNPTQFVIEVE